MTLHIGQPEPPCHPCEYDFLTDRKTHTKTQKSNILSRFAPLLGFGLGQILVQQSLRRDHIVMLPLSEERPFIAFCKKSSGPE